MFVVSVYHQYHQEIKKRTAPVLKSIEKRRKKKEQEVRANAMKLAEIQESTMNEKENRIIDEVKKVAEPMPIPLKDNTTKKKKVKPSSINNVIPPIAQIIQMEDPSDFVPTIYTETRRIISPRPPPEPRPKSSHKPSHVTPRIETSVPPPLPKPEELIPVKSLETNRSFSIDPIPSLTNIVESRPSSAVTKQTDKMIIERQQTPTPRPPSASIKRTDTVITERQQTPTPRPSSALTKRMNVAMIEPEKPPTPRPSSALTKRMDVAMIEPEKPPTPRPSSALTKRMNVAMIEPEKPPTPRPSSALTKRMNVAMIEPEKPPTPRPSSALTKRMNVAMIEPEKPPTPRPSSALTKRMDVPVIEPEKPPTPRPSSALMKRTNIIVVESPRPPTPRKRSVEEKRPIKMDNSFLREARRWAEKTREITFANLLQTSEEAAEQIPNRKTGGTLRKLPDLDSNLLSKLTKNQLPQEVRLSTYFYYKSKDCISRYHFSYWNNY